MASIRLWLQKILDLVDRYLDSVTSYRLVLYALLAYAGWGTVAAIFGKLPFHFHEIVLSAAWLSAICYGSNWLLSRLLDIPRNKDSDLISALILALIMNPAHVGGDYVVLAAAGLVAMISKYLLVIGKRHIFNPAALGAFFAGLLFHHYASWWVGTNIMTPFVVVGGLLVLRKMKRFKLTLSFLITYAVVLLFKSHGLTAVGYGHLLWLVLSSTSVIFFTSIMLIEPLTSPDKYWKYQIYAGLAGLLYGGAVFHLAPEEVLLVGNVATYALEPGRRLILEFTKMKREAEGIYSFYFKPDHRLKFTAGQYMEWTLPTHHSDNRGNRRYLTIASSPRDDELMFSLRIPDKPSSFKRQLAKFKVGDEMLASHLSGSFVLPKKADQKLAFIAGGIGVTPFHSIIKQLVDADQFRPIVTLYCADSPLQFAYEELFARASKRGMRTFYCVTNPDNLKDWHGLSGRIDGALIKRTIPDYRARLFYVSGPYGMVSTIRRTLLEAGLSHKQIITDYFPGYG